MDVLKHEIEKLNMLTVLFLHNKFHRTPTLPEIETSFATNLYGYETPLSASIIASKGLTGSVELHEL